MYIYLYIFIYVCILRIFFQPGFAISWASAKARRRLGEFSSFLASSCRHLQPSGDVSIILLLLVCISTCLAGTTFRPIQLLKDAISISFRLSLLLQGVLSNCLAAPGQHFDLSRCSGTTFRPIQLSAAAPGRHVSQSFCSGTPFRSHFDLCCCSGASFRPAWWLQDNISMFSRCSGTTFRFVLLLTDYPAALGRHFDLSGCDISTCPAAPG